MKCARLDGQWGTEARTWKTYPLFFVLLHSKLLIVFRFGKFLL